MFSPSARPTPPEFTFALASAKEIGDIIRRIPEVLDAAGFALLYTYDYHNVVASKGFPIERKVYVYEICRAQTASKMLTENPDFAPFMPCRVAVYEKDAATVIATPDMEPMLSALPQQSDLAAEA